MNIRHKCSYKLFTYGKNKGKHQIRLRVTFNSQRIDLSTGCQIYDLKDDKYESVLDGYVGPKGESTVSINTELRNIKNQMETAFKYFEANDIIPTPSQLVEKYEECLDQGHIPENGGSEERPAHIQQETEILRPHREHADRICRISER